MLVLIIHSVLSNRFCDKRLENMSKSNFGFSGHDPDFDSEKLFDKPKFCHVYALIGVKFI